MIIADVTKRPLSWLLYGESTRNDIAFTHREDIDTLLSLFSQLPESARSLVMDQALLLAQYMISMTRPKEENLE